MLRSRSGLFTVFVIFFGLGLTVWWMYSAEETVSVPRKVVDETAGKTLASSPRELATEKKGVETNPTSPLGQIRKLAVLQEILDSKNDNDPRLDSDFKTLSESEKKALQEKYLSYAPEKLNERGTLVYLLGRNIENEKDLKFMEYVLNEKPCLSMANCSVKAPPPTGEAAHLNSVDQITLAYPQMVTIKSIERFLTENKVDPQLKPLALKNLEDATHSRSPLVAQTAALTRKRVSP